MGNIVQARDKTQHISICTQRLSLHRRIVQLALPAIASYIMRTFYQLIDAYWIGKLGSEAQAGLSASNFLIWALYAISALGVTGTTTFVAQATGAKKPHEAQFSAAHGFFVISCVSVFVIVTGLVMERKIFLWMGLESGVFFQASSYFRPILYGLIFFSTLAVIEGIFHGLGDTRTPMTLLLSSLIVNIIFDPLFIFGVGGFSGFGLSGAALATVFAQASAAATGVAILIKRGFVPTFYYHRKPELSLKRLGTIMKIGAPVAFSGFSFSIIYVFLTRIISLFGTSSVAAVGICHRIEGVAYFTCMGFSVAASTLVGQYIGAERIKKAEKSAWLVSGYGVTFLAFISFIFYYCSQTLVSVFTHDPEVIRVGSLYLEIIAIFEIFIGLEIIIGAAFSGAGDTLPPLMVNLPLTALRIPLAWYLSVSQSMGIEGVWWAISGTTCLKGTCVSLLFLMGRWKEKRILTHDI
jgi:putative MATE family efflux protein